VVEWWSGGVVEWWSGGVVEYWSIGVLEYWSIGVLECWSAGVLRLTMAEPADDHYSITPILHHSRRLITDSLVTDYWPGPAVTSPLRAPPLQLPESTPYFPPLCGCRY